MNIWAKEMSELTVRSLERLPQEIATWVHEAAESETYLPQIFGLAIIRPKLVHDTMAPLTPPEQDQVTFWQRILHQDLDRDELYIFDIVNVCPLRTPVVAQRFSARSFRGLVCDMEEGQAPRLREMLASTPTWLPLVLPQVAVRLPLQHAALCVACVWKSFALPQVKVGWRAGGTAATFKWRDLGIGQAHVPKAPAIAWERASHVDVERARAGTHRLRAMASRLDLRTAAGQEEYKTLAVLNHHKSILASVMDPFAFFQSAIVQNMKGDIPHLDHRRQLSYQVVFMLKVFMLGDLLRESCNFMGMVRQTVLMVLPPSMHRIATSFLAQMAAQIPSESSISRWRMLIDGALMLATRSATKELSDAGVGHSRSFMADASQQHGREFEHIMMRSIRLDRIASCFQKANNLINMWKHADLDIDIDDEMLAAEKAYMSDLAKDILVHHFPLVHLGSGRKKLGDIFQSIAYAVFLDFGYTLKQAAQVIHEMGIGTFDLGTEFSLSKIDPIRFSELFPWMPESLIHPPPPVREHLEDDDFEDPLPPPAPEPFISFRRSLTVPGTLHVTHNASNAVLETMPAVAKAVDGLAQVMRFLSAEFTCTRMLELCFDDPAGRTLHKRLKKVQCKVYKKRWGSVAFATKEVLEVIFIRRRWSLRRYCAGSGRHRPIAAGPGEDDQGPNIQIVDESISSPTWWAHITTLDFVYMLVHHRLI